MIISRTRSRSAPGRLHTQYDSGYSGSPPQEQGVQKRGKKRECRQDGVDEKEWQEWFVTDEYKQE